MSWADIQSGEEEDGREDRDESVFTAGSAASAARDENPEDPSEYWAPHRVERAARRGFELRQRGDHWDLKISMGALDPPFTEVGMERYCRWLRGRLASFREEHGAEGLRRCRGEVDFSHNSMSNQMVWTLLETLAQNDVHTALLKLFGNHISQGGVLAICEFIRKNERAEALQELHLSHNEIDDDAALELLRTLQLQRPKYPPRRLQEGSGEERQAPMWLRLNHNRIREPEVVRRSAESEGITICTAGDRQACGTSKCCRRECPLVHLYSFNMQARRRPSPTRQTHPTSVQAESLASDPAAEVELPPSESVVEDGDGNGDARSRRKRNRKAGSKEKKDHNDSFNHSNSRSEDLDDVST